MGIRKFKTGSYAHLNSKAPSKMKQDFQDIGEPSLKFVSFTKTYRYSDSGTYTFKSKCGKSFIGPSSYFDVCKVEGTMLIDIIEGMQTNIAKLQDDINEKKHKIGELHNKLSYISIVAPKTWDETKFKAWMILEITKAKDLSDDEKVSLISKYL